MKFKLARTALKNIKRNLRRSILSAVAIGVASMSIVFLFSMIGGMKADMAYNLQTYYTGEVRIRNSRYEEFERYNPLHLTVDWESARQVLSGNDQIEHFVPRTTFPSSIYIEGTNFGTVGVGADFELEEKYQDLDSILKAGRIPEKGKNEMLMGAVLARDLDLEIGDSVTVLATTAARGSNAITLEIVGLAGFPVASLNSKYFWMPHDVTQYFLRMNGGVQEVLIGLKEDADAEAAAEKIEQDLETATGTDHEVRVWTDITTTYGFMKMAQTIYNIIAGFFFLLGSTVIINTTMMVIFERMREIGTLSAMGMHGSELTKMFFLEGAFISAVGSAIGVGIGIGLTIYFSSVGLDFTDAMSGMDFEISSIMYPRLSVFSTAFVYVYSITISCLATLIPSRKAAKIEPVEALRYI